jgi:hypothetical protein
LLRILPFLLVPALWIYAFVDCLSTPEAGKVRHGAAPSTGSTSSEGHRDHRPAAAGPVAPDGEPAFPRRRADG